MLERPKLAIVSPSLHSSDGVSNGNSQTALRWAQMLAGHANVQTLLDWPASPAAPGDVLWALHARRSAPALARWHAAYPAKPSVLVLTGTDVYRDIHTDASAQAALRMATHLVVLQSEALHELPAEHLPKARVIVQSCATWHEAKAARFTAVMVGHLRDEKDPLTFMRAAALCQNMQFLHIGEALDDALGQSAEQTAAQHAQYQWLGGLTYAQTRQRVASANVLVHASQMEGGAHAIMEAVTSGTPVLASRISGNVGMLGQDYEGYFDLGNHTQLAGLLHRCVQEPAYLARLNDQCAKRAPLFEPQAEQNALIALLADCTHPRTPTP